MLGFCCCFVLFLPSLSPRVGGQILSAGDRVAAWVFASQADLAEGMHIAGPHHTSTPPLGLSWGGCLGCYVKFCPPLSSLVHLGHRLLKNISNLRIGSQLSF